MRNIRIAAVYRKLDLLADLALAIDRAPIPALLELVPAPKPAPIPLTTGQEIRHEHAVYAQGLSASMRYWADLRHDRSPILSRPMHRADSTGLPYLLTL